MRTINEQKKLKNNRSLPLSNKRKKKNLITNVNQPDDPHQKVVIFPNFNPNSFRRFFALNLLHKLLVPSTSRYSSQMSSVVSLFASSWFRSDRESPDTKPLSGRDRDCGLAFNCWNHLATLAVEESCNER